MSEEDFFVEQGRTAKLTYTVHQDWCDMMPISHGAARMHRILRSMMVETKDGEPKPTRKLTMDRLCWIMSSFEHTPGRKTKPVGEQTIRDYRKELMTNGMIDIIPGRIKTEPPRYVVHDLPPDGWRGWRNAWHADDAYTADWRTHTPRPSTTDSENGHSVPRSAGGSPDEPGQFPTRSAVPHGVPGGGHGTPGYAAALTCGDGTLNKGVKEEPLTGLSSSSSYSSSGASGQPLRGREEDEEEKTHAPPAGRPAAERHPDTDKAINKFNWPKGKEPRGRDLTRVRDAVSVLLREGWTPERVVAVVNAKVRWAEAKSPVAVVVYVLTKDAGDPSAGRSALEEAIESLKAEIAARDAAVAACTGCDESGWTEQGRHDHGRRGANDELWELQNPEQAALNRRMNAQKVRAA